MSADPATQETIKDRLSWLTIIEAMRAQIPQLTSFADEVRKAGFKSVVVLGMGGSSLSADVFAADFPTQRGYPDLYMLDSTDPGRVLLVRSGLAPRTTLYIVASKSGTTTEPLAMFQFFWPDVEKVQQKRAGANFVAITDPGTPLEALAQEHQFRRVWTNPADIGGRYSVLSYFGLVPAALMGVDLGKLLDRAQEMAVACAAEIPPAQNPALWLGAALGALAKAGRNKVTFVLPPALREFGFWLEQLIAESTGKDGTGILPVEGEPLGSPEVYGDDRVFVHWTLAGSKEKEPTDALAALQAGGHPVITIQLRDVYDLGGEFFRWELTTAVAGHILGVNPFDEPNVTESKDNTKRLLEQYQQKHRLPEEDPTAEEGMISLYNGPQGSGDLADTLATFLRTVQPGDYIAIQAYIDSTNETMDLLEAIRARLRDELRVATTLGYGPRFLHSTGQFHKGGPRTGVFIQITADEANDAKLPGGEYSFATLLRAQALGDLEALRSKDLRVVRLHLAEPEAGLEELRDLIMS